MLQLNFIKQSTAAGVAGARGERAAPPVASGWDVVIVHVTVPGRLAMGTIASAKVWSTKFAQITSVSNTFSVNLFITMHVRLNGQRQIQKVFI